MEVKVRAVVKVRFLRILSARRGKSENRKGIEESGGVISPMSMTRPNQGLVEGSGNRPNVSKTNEKQGLEGGVGNCTNA